MALGIMVTFKMTARNAITQMEALKRMQSHKMLAETETASSKVGSMQTPH